MSFAAPLYLLGLLALPALVAWYVGQQRTRARAAAAFAAPTMTPSVAPHRPGPRRHAPMGVFALALVVLAVAAARPHRTISVPVPRLATMLALDMSGSMQASDVSPTRAAAAQRAADVFVTGVPAQVKVGVMQFNQTPDVLQLPTSNRKVVFAALGRLQIGGGTAIGSAIEESLALLPRSPLKGAAAGKGAAAVIVLLSDGKSTSGPDALAAARRAKSLHVPIFTVSLGTANGTITVPRQHGTGSVTERVPPDHEALAQIARASGGQAYTAADADHLSQIYKQLSFQLAHVSQRQELTAFFAGVGLLLLLLGSVMSLGWFGRLI